MNKQEEHKLSPLSNQVPTSRNRPSPPPQRNTPSIDVQIHFLDGARKVLQENSKTEILLNQKDFEMLTAIEENLIAIRLHKIGDQHLIKELVAALLEAKTIIKTWHNMGANQQVGERMWKIYDSTSPEMLRLNKVINKYTAAIATKQEEVQHG